MTYEQLLGKQPASTVVGDRVIAQKFVDVIDAQLASGNTSSEFTVSQRTYLYKLRAKWSTRAKGNDTSWNTYGGKPGRRKGISDKSSKVDTTVYGDEDQMDPLLKSLLSKYGEPLRTDDI